jgi:hypothetical protein
MSALPLKADNKQLRASEDGTFFAGFNFYAMIAERPPTVTRAGIALGHLTPAGNRGSMSLSGQKATNAQQKVMSALGQKQTLPWRSLISAIPPKADMV